jgi:hypothetical protein
VTYRVPRHVGKTVTGTQELGYVEQTARGWAWHARMIPGPYGAFAKGTATTEEAAQAALERHWDKYLVMEAR